MILGTPAEDGTSAKADDASPPPQVVAPKVLPVAAKLDVPSLAPPAQPAPSRTSVDQAVRFWGSPTGIPTTHPRNVPQSP